MLAEQVKRLAQAFGNLLYPILEKILKENGATCVLGLDDILTSSIDGSGYNEQYGLLGSNKATEERIKLFPSGKSQKLVEDIQKAIKWLKFNVSEYLLVNFWGEKYIETDYLVKEFEEAMKGE